MTLTKNRMMPMTKNSGPGQASSKNQPSQKTMPLTNLRKHVLFIRGAVKVMKSSQSTAELYKRLKEYHSMLREVDPTMVWYKGKKTDPFEKDTINDPKKWPMMSTKMKEYAHDVKTQPAGGMCYFMGQIGFEGDQETFKEDTKGAAELISRVCYPNMLQYLEVSETLIIMNSYPEMNAPWWSA